MEIGLIVLVFVIVVGAALVADGFVVIHQQEEAVVELFGKFNRKMTAGLNLKIPVIEKVTRRDLRVQQLDVEVETKTSDDVFVKLKISTQYQIVDIHKAVYQLAEPESQLESYIFDVVRSQVPKLQLDDVFAKKDDIALAVKKELGDAMDDFGFKIIQALVTDIDPDSRVKDAMNEINMAKRLRLAATEKGEAEKIAIVKKAEAEADSKKLQGQGIANQRKAIVDGLRESIKELSDATGIKAEEVQALILTTQYFDTLKSMSDHSKATTVFMPLGANGAHDVQTQILAALKAHEDSK
jgi:regulator of protease activity HflC (stomatin/prohibitin superfamily)